MYPAVLVCVAPEWLGEDMSSDNPSGADNQQERLISSFNVSFAGSLKAVSRIRILRGHTQSSLFEARGMKRWSMPHGDMGKTVQNYNRPKVDLPGNVHLGLPLTPVMVMSAAGYLLETPLYPALLVQPRQSQEARC